MTWTYIDTDLLRRTMAAVEEADERGEWDQKAWRTETDCGTAYCFAGWVAQLERREWVTTETIKTTPEETAHGDDFRAYDGSDQVYVGDWARKRLGLDPYQASTLFAARNGINDLRTIVNRLCAQAAREKNADNRH